MIDYFLRNGLNIQKTPLDDILLTFTSVCKYLADDPPIEILELLLDYGAEVDKINKYIFK